MKFKFNVPKIDLRKGPPARKLFLASVVGTLALAGLCFIFYLMTSRPANFKQVPPEQASETAADTKQETKAEEDVPTIDEAINAAIRAHERATKVCYDEKIEGFLIHYPYQKPDANGQQYFNGWYYLKWHQMWKTQNGIWFMKDFDANEYLKVYPDVTGLNCKNT